jgi:hypothetical protein
MGCVMYELIKFEPLFCNRDKQKLMSEENPKIPDTEASQKLKKIYTTLLRNTLDRPSSHDVLKVSRAEI